MMDRRAFYEAQTEQRIRASRRYYHRLLRKFYSNVWRPALSVAEKLGFKSTTLPQNWLSLADIKNLLQLAGWEVIKTDTRILWPIRTPLLDTLLNRWIAPLLKHFCLAVFV